MAKSQIEDSVKARMAQFSSKLKPQPGEQPKEDKFGRLIQYVGKIVSLPVAEICFDENVRTAFDSESPEFLSLVNSIKRDGVAQNLIVELREVKGKYRVYCVAGQRRGMAAKAAGVTHVPCLIRQYKDSASRIAEGLVENLLREDLHFIDVATGYRDLVNHGWTKDQIAEVFGKNEKTVRRYLALAEWPTDILNRLRQFPHVFTVRVVFHKLVNRRFPSLDALHEAIEQIIAPGDNLNYLPPLLDTIRTVLEKNLKMKVSLKGTPDQGELKVRYNSKDQLELLQKLLSKSG